MNDQPAGRQYWQSLHEYADGPEFRAELSREFPGYDPDELLGMSRRQFMKLAGASMALAGLTLTGCRRWPEEEVVPHNHRPEGSMPGMPQQYATMHQRGGVAYGVFATTVDGRPIHLSGSPLHPINGNPELYKEGKLKIGSADSFTIASILNLYDPDRTRTVGRRGEEGAAVATWADFAEAFKPQGKRLAVLSQANSGPTFQAQKNRLLEAFPGATWATWEPINRDHEIAGSEKAFGRPLRPLYDLRKVQVLATFDSDLLTDHPAALQHARGWATNRKSCDDGHMSRTYAVGPTLTPTSSNADEHLQVRPSAVAAMLDALAVKLGVPGADFGVNLQPLQQAFVDRLAADLDHAHGKSLVTVGPAQPPDVHALAWAVNGHLGNLGQTVQLVDEPDAQEPLRANAIGDLARRIDAGEIDLLLILGGNPVFDAPAELDLAQLLKKVPVRAHLTQYDNETTRACQWHLPEAHDLECWGDGRAWDGTLCLQQPLIQPLFAGKSAVEVLAMLAGDPLAAGYELVRRAWTKPLGGGTYDERAGTWGSGGGENETEKAWRRAVHDGLVLGSGFEPVDAPAGRARKAGGSTTHQGFEVVLRADPKVYDGRYANNGWLQEVPEAMTKVSWDNPALVSVADAREMKLKNGDIVRVAANGRDVEAPVYVMPGQPRGVVILTLGQGHTAGGRIARGVGFNAYPLRAAAGANASSDLIYGAAVERTGKKQALATTSIHHLIDPGKLGAQGVGAVTAYGLNERIGHAHGMGSLVKQASLSYYLSAKGRNFANEGAHGDVTLQLYDPPRAAEFRERARMLAEEHPEAVAEGWEPPTAFNEPHAWGMTIDMTTCLGCTSCIIACQSENNIPIVGKDQVIMSREMHWLRIDTYYRSAEAVRLDDEAITSSENLDVVHMPLMCVHCENAPCEQVCPVAATVHDTEGLNTMVYNRCIGTRYCSNNCPYKVRRFNYFDYHSKLDGPMFRNRGGAGGVSNDPWLKFPDQEQGDTIDQVRRMVYNPDVTVRMRGVMEKCTYCVQRISRAKIYAKADWAKAKLAVDRLPPGAERDAAMSGFSAYPEVADGTIITACEAACPTGALTFGNLNDPDSRVSKLQTRNPRSYTLLSELNTRARTQHLGLVRNPVARAAGASPSEGGGH